jgi:L-malate glycosyltransferase
MNMPEPLEILEFANALAIGGTERQFVNLVRGVDPTKFRVHVGALARGGQLTEEIDETRVPISEYPIRRLYGPGALVQQYRLARYILRERVQLIHTHGFYANVFALPPAFLARTPVRIASIRDDGSVWTAAQRSVERIVCRLADCTVVNAEMIGRRLVAEGWPTERVAVIPNGVDLARFHKRDGRSALHGELGLPATAPIIGVLARLAPCKGLEVFLDAARIVANSFPDARFLVVGDQGSVPDGDGAVRPYRQILEERVVRLGLTDRIVFTGFRLDVPELLAEFTVSVLPSITGEGLPNSVLESMAAGLPVVATNSGGTGEAVENKQTGLLVPPGDAAALAQAIMALLAEPLLGLRMGEAGRRRVAERFSLNRMATAMQTLYERLLRDRKQVATSWARMKNA